MKNRKFNLVVLFFLILAAKSSVAQKWQWSKSGAWHLNDLSSMQQVYNKKVVVDANGNSYSACNVSNRYPSASNVFDIDSVKMKFIGDDDICLVSYDCAGNFRWKKMIGSKGSESISDMELDSLGGLYFAIYSSPKDILDTIKLDSDTFLTKSNLLKRSVVLIKYDSSGDFKWAHFPETDTINANGISSYCNSISVSPMGDLSAYLTSINLKSYENGKFTLPASSEEFSPVALTYNKDGIFQKGTVLNISNLNPLSYNFIEYAKDFKNGFHYAQCVTVDDFYYNPTFGGTGMTNSSLIAQFDSLGNANWVRQSTSNYLVPNYVLNKPFVDPNGNLFTCFIENPGYKFHTFNITNSLSSSYVPILIKWNTLGNIIWAKTMNNTQLSYASMAWEGNKTICLATSGRGRVSIDTFAKATDGQDNIFLSVIDAGSGKAKLLDSAQGTTFTAIRTVGADSRGNFYLGGTFFDGLYFPGPGLTPFVRAGVGGAMYLAKYGEATCIPEVSTIKSIVSENSNSLKFYPNPTVEFLNIDGLNSQSQICIFNLLGQQIISLNVNQSNVRISTKTWTPGIYIIQIKSQNATSISKVEKSNN